jgi:hypothetical protein
MCRTWRTITWLAWQLGRVVDRRQRIAQLVRQHGQEFVLAPGRRLQLVDAAALVVHVGQGAHPVPLAALGLVGQGAVEHPAVLAAVVAQPVLDLERCALRARRMPQRHQAGRVVRVDHVAPAAAGQLRLRHAGVFAPAIVHVAVRAVAADGPDQLRDQARHRTETGLAFARRALGGALGRDVHVGRYRANQAPVVVDHRRRADQDGLALPRRPERLDLDDVGDGILAFQHARQRPFRRGDGAAGLRRIGWPPALPFAVLVDALRRRMAAPDAVVGRVDRQQAALRVGVDDADRRRVQQRAQAPAVFLGGARGVQRELLAAGARQHRGLALGDVDRHAGEAARPRHRIGEHLAARVDPHVLPAALGYPVFDVVQGVGVDRAADRGQHRGPVVGVDHVGEARQLGARAGQRGVDLEQAREAFVHQGRAGGQVDGPGADVAGRLE